MTESKITPDKKQLTCPICSSTFIHIFPAGECQTCFQVVCGHCIHHDNPDHPSSTCQDCVQKQTPYGQVAQMDPDELLAVLHDSSSKNSPLAARLLGDRDDQAAVAPLCQALESNRIDVRREAATALGKLGGNQAISALLKALNDTAPAVRGRVASSLAELGEKEALPALIKQLDDTSLQAAGHAVHAVGKLMGKKACDLLKDMVQGHVSGFIRCEALTVLAGLNHEMALAAALECLDDPKKEVIISACKILTKLNDLEAAPKLEALIEKKLSASVRIAAQTTLYYLLNPKA